MIVGPYGVVLRGEYACDDQKSVAPQNNNTQNLANLKQIRKKRPKKKVGGLKIKCRGSSETRFDQV